METAIDILFFMGKYWWVFGVLFAVAGTCRFLMSIITVQ